MICNKEMSDELAKIPRIKARNGSISITCKLETIQLFIDLALRAEREEGKADGIKEGMERAAGICDGQKVYAYAQSVALADCAQAIRSEKEKL